MTQNWNKMPPDDENRRRLVRILADIVCQLSAFDAPGDEPQDSDPAVEDCHGSENGPDKLD